MKKNNNQTLEVLEPEVEEIPLEQVIDNTLVKHNVTDTVIATLKEKYVGMQLRSLDDKENYIDIKDARKEVRKIGILTEKLCKKGREDAIAIQKKWLAKEKEILGKISEVENPLNDEIEKFENEVKRKELEEEKQREEIWINRQASLSKMGVVYSNGSFVLNHISYEVDLIKAADDEQWNDTILPKYKKVYEEVQSALVEEENKRKAEIELAKKQREEFEAQQAEFKKQQELFAQQQAEVKRQMDDAEKEKRLQQERIESDARIKKGQILDARFNQLNRLGLTLNHIYNAYAFEDINVDVATEINLFDEGEWNALIDKIVPIIQERKQIAEQRKADELEKQKQAAIQKAIEDAKVKQEQETQRQREELAKAGDKAKWMHVMGQLNAIELPTMNSGIYRNKISILKEKLEEVNSL